MYVNKGLVPLLFLMPFIFAVVPIVSGYHSQFNQDSFLNQRFFKNKRNGTFVDIGAHDGVTLSNSLFYEQDLGWHGICIEPMQEVFAKLKASRSCVCVNGCISDTEGDQEFLRVHSNCVNTEMLSGLVGKYDPRHRERVNHEIKVFGGSVEVIIVPCYTFNSLMKENNITVIDILSIDTEGGELDILKTIDFDAITIGVIDVENNFEADTSIRKFLELRGFIFIKRLVCDEIYYNPRVLN